MRDRNAALDGVRGFAALIVVFYHGILGFDPTQVERLLHGTIWHHSGHDLWQKLGLTLFNGESAVNIFFLLSGCVLIGSLETQIVRHGFWKASLAFSVRRVFRIFPASIACILAIAGVMLTLSQVFPHTVPAYSPMAVFNNLLLISPDVHGATWTLQVEMLAVPFLLVAGLLRVRFATLGILAFALYMLIARKNASWLGDWHLMQLTLVYFAFGTLVPTEVGRYAAHLTRRIHWGVPLAVFFFAQKVIEPHTFLTTIEVTAGFLFLSHLVHSEKGARIPLFVGPTGSFLGRMSYGFYLWNVLFLNVLFIWRPHYPQWMIDHATEAGVVAALLIVPPSLAMAYLSERYVEQPGIRLGNVVAQWLVRPRPAREVLVPAANDDGLPIGAANSAQAA